jgi:hypothetical protein
MKEGNLSALIQMEASKRGHRLFRNQMGAYTDPKSGQFIRYGVGGKGGSDLIGITRDGKFAAIEVKIGRGKPTPEQIKFVEFIHSMGGRAAVVWSVDEAMAALE